MRVHRHQRMHYLIFIWFIEFQFVQARRDVRMRIMRICWTWRFPRAKSAKFKLIQIMKSILTIMDNLQLRIWFSKLNVLSCNCQVTDIIIILIQILQTRQLDHREFISTNLVMTLLNGNSYHGFQSLHYQTRNYKFINIWPN